LPTNIVDLEAQRIVKKKMTLTDEVEQVYLKLYNDDEFRKYREGLDRDETVEGSIYADDTVAAQMIRKEGIELGLPMLSDTHTAHLTAIGNSLRVAERRVNAARSQRKKAPVDEAPPKAQAS
jgi:hypothetical protein